MKNTQTTELLDPLKLERCAMAMEVNTDGIWDWQVNSNEVYFDPGYYTMAGYAPFEFPGRFEEWEKRLHPDDLAEAKTKIERCFAGETELYQAIFRFKTKTGDWIWIRARGKVFERDAKGQTLRMLGTHTDITDLKQAETVRQISEANYRLLIENAHDCIFVVQQGVVKYANPGTVRLTGYSQAELTQMSFLDLVHPDDRELVKNRYIQRLAGQAAPNYYTFRITTRTGEERVLEINGVRQEWQAEPAILCFVRDITETKKMEMQLLQSQKMQAIGTLAGGIAHDFNNILAAMMGYTELCQMTLPPGGKNAHHLERVLQAGHRARDLVSQILTFSRQEESGKKPVQISLIVNEALRLLRASIPATIEFQEAIDRDTGVVMADPTRIHQIIMNLCTNAAHAMQNTGGTLEVRLTNYDIESGGPQTHTGLKPGPCIRLTVCDTGKGMDPSTVKQIFDPYFTTKSQGEGTGLGLSVVHGIVTSIQGAIKVYSEPGEGTTFQVYIPRIEADLDQTTRPEGPLPRGSETILLVDDEESLLEMTTELLENMGYTIVPRTSSVEAFHAFQAAPDRFDLVITDQTMPKLTGIALALRIKDIRGGIPVILCTGFSAGITRQRGECATNIRAILNKPVLKRELAGIVRGVLDNGTGLSF